MATLVEEEDDILMKYKNREKAEKE